MPIRAIGVLVAILFCITAPPHAGSQSPRLSTSPGRFVLDGQPFQILSGEMHYPRIPREYWRDRFRKARAMGLNTISTYVFWNLHEPSPGKYDFTGQKDVAAFIREAADEGLHVIVRPGPYVCAEWDLGGYPAWLLADPALVLRSTARASRHRQNAGSRGSDRSWRPSSRTVAVPSSRFRSRMNTDRSTRIRRISRGTATCSCARASGASCSTPPTATFSCRTARFPIFPRS
ncbi:MAG TPA: beta-galactosidase [Vicinamibacterales bacterium]|nr:beta-galactosidase [Vicinamibacterales bacterium]